MNRMPTKPSGQMEVRECRALVSDVSQNTKYDITGIRILSIDDVNVQPLFDTNSQ